MRLGFVMAALLAIAAGACGDRDSSPPEVVARAGGRVIDMKEVKRSYSLEPRWRRGQTVLDSYLTQVGALVDQKVLALEAERLGLDRDSLVRGYLDFITHKEMIKALYRRHVRDRVRVSDEESRRMYEWMKKSVRIEYVFTRDSLTGVECAGILARAGIDAIPNPPDSSMVKGRRDSVRVGSVAPELEEAVFSSGINRVRGPIRVAGGFMTLKVTGGTVQKFASENDYALQRQTIEKMLGDRKADSLASAYVASLMQDKDLRLNPGVFWGVAGYFERRVRESHLDPMNMQTIYVTSDEIRLLESDLDAMGNAVVATHRGGRLTVGELMQSLANMPGSLRPRVRTPQNLKNAIGVIVRNQYLLREAEREGLATDAGVLQEAALQRDEALATAYCARRSSEIPVTRADIENVGTRQGASMDQVFYTLRAEALARSAKLDSVLQSELPQLWKQYGAAIDTVRLRSSLEAPGEILTRSPVRILVREVFQ